MQSVDENCVICLLRIETGSDVLLLRACEHLVHAFCIRNALRTGRCPVDGQLLDVEQIHAHSTNVVVFHPPIRPRLTRLKDNENQLTGIDLANSRRNVAWILRHDFAQYEDAITWLNYAYQADNSNPNMLLDYADCFEKGVGVPQDSKVAMELREQAAPRVAATDRKNHAFLGALVISVVNEDHDDSAVAEVDGQLPGEGAGNASVQTPPVNSETANHTEVPRQYEYSPVSMPSSPTDHLRSDTSHFEHAQPQVQFEPPRSIAAECNQENTSYDTQSSVQHDPSTFTTNVPASCSKTQDRQSVSQDNALEHRSNQNEVQSLDEGRSKGAAPSHVEQSSPSSAPPLCVVNTEQPKAEHSTQPEDFSTANPVHSAQPRDECRSTIPPPSGSVFTLGQNFNSVQPISQRSQTLDIQALDRIGARENAPIRHACAQRPCVDSEAEQHAKAPKEYEDSPSSVQSDRYDPPQNDPTHPEHVQLLGQVRPPRHSAAVEHDDEDTPQDSKSRAQRDPTIFTTNLPIVCDVHDYPSCHCTGTLDLPFRNVVGKDDECPSSQPDSSPLPCPSPVPCHPTTIGPSILSAICYFISTVQSSPNLLHTPDLVFFTDYLRSLNATIPQSTISNPDIHYITSLADWDAFVAQSAPRPIVIEFFAKWCGPCSTIASEFKETAGEFAQRVVFVKIDVDIAVDVAKKFSVTSTPTFKLLVDAEQVDEVARADLQALRQMVEKAASLTVERKEKLSREEGGMEEEGKGKVKDESRVLTEMGKDPEVLAEADRNMNPVDVPMGPFDVEISEAQMYKQMELKMIASQFEAEGNLDGALQVWNDVIAIKASPLTLAKRAEVFVKLKQPYAAIQDCEKALQINSDSAKSLKVKGMAYLLLGNWEKGALSLRRGNQLDYDEKAGELQRIAEERWNKIRNS